MCADVLCLDVAFETYRVLHRQPGINEMLSTNANSIKTILIQKIESPVNHTVTNVALPDMTSHIDGTTVSYANKCLTLTFSSLTCSADGYYICIVIKEDDSQIEVPAYLHVQLKNMYSFFTC